MRLDRMPVPVGPLDPVIDESAPSDDGAGIIRRGMIAILLFFVGLGGWAALTPLDAGVTASGVVTVAGHRQTVQHPDGGVITALRVREGQRVHAGDVLIELDRRDPSPPTSRR